MDAERDVEAIGQVAEDAASMRESGRPGGGQGRIDHIGHSGVYPASLPDGASGDAAYQGLSAQGQGERGPEGYYDHGDSEIGEIRPEGWTAVADDAPSTLEGTA